MSNQGKQKKNKRDTIIISMKTKTKTETKEYNYHIDEKGVLLVIGHNTSLLRGSEKWNPLIKSPFQPANLLLELDTSKPFFKNFAKGFCRTDL